MQPLAARLRTARILWGGLFASVLLYGVVLLQVRSTRHAAVPAFLPEILALVAVGLASASILLPRRIFGLGVARLNLLIEQGPTESVGGFREAGTQRVVVDPEGSTAKAFGTFQTCLILGMALAEAIGLFGFILGFLGESLEVAAAFFVASLALMATKFPRVTTVTSAIERATKAECRLPGYDRG